MTISCAPAKLSRRHRDVTRAHSLSTSYDIYMSCYMCLQTVNAHKVHGRTVFTAPPVRYKQTHVFVIFLRSRLRFVCRLVHSGGAREYCATASARFSYVLSGRMNIIRIPCTHTYTHTLTCSNINSHHEERKINIIVYNLVVGDKRTCVCVCVRNVLLNVRPIEIEEMHIHMPATLHSCTHVF